VGIAGSSQLDIWTTPFYPIAGYIAAMSFRTFAASGALLIALAVPAAAEAATFAPLEKPCYVTAGARPTEREGVKLAASGFTPNSLVDLAIDGEVIDAGLQTDANGAIGVLSPFVIPAPFIKTGSGDFTVSLTEQGNPANTASVVGRHTALGVKVKPQRAKPSSKIRFKGAGFTQDKPVYAHYVFKGKLKKTVKMSGDQNACGEWKKRAKQIPVKNPSTGIWTVQFDQLKKYKDPFDRSSTFNSVFAQLRISVTRVFG
jgi:hypothetical protein